MSDLSAAAQALGIPEVLVERSAEARAAETGVPAEEIIAAWAGGGSAPAGEDKAEVDPTPTETPEPDVETESETPEITIEIPSAEESAPEPAAATTRADVPTEVNAAEAANLPVVITVPTVGIKERTNFTVPKWMAAMFFLVPVLALFALGGSATGVCGDATELDTDVVSGRIVNCDGSEFEGSGVGGGGTDFIALGDGVYHGSEVTGVNCAGCHGASGGGGAGPALNGVLNVFGSCADHIEWIDLATGGLQAAGRSTYGDTNKPLGGFGSPMPGFAGSLTEEQVAAVAAFERVRFGGQDPDAALADCGLVEEVTPDGETAPEGGSGADESGTGEADAGETTTTAPAPDA